MFKASVVSEIKPIRKEVSTLVQELRELRSSVSGRCSGIPTIRKTCLVFVRFGGACDQQKLGKVNLDSLHLS